MPLRRQRAQPISTPTTSRLAVNGSKELDTIVNRLGSTTLQAQLSNSARTSKTPVVATLAPLCQCPATIHVDTRAPILVIAFTATRSDHFQTIALVAETSCRLDMWSTCLLSVVAATQMLQRFPIGCERWVICRTRSRSPLPL